MILRLSDLSKNAGRIIAALFLCLMAFTLVLLLFLNDRTEYYLKSDIGVSNLLLLIAGVIVSVIAIAVLAVVFKNARINSFQGTIFIIVSSVILFILELLYTSSAFFFSDWDPAAVLDCVYKILRDAGDEVSIDYFSNHPNNLMIVFIYVTVLRISGIFGSQSVLCLTAFQCMLFTLAGVLLFLIAKEIYSIRSAMFIWVVYALWIGFNPWLIITYSDCVGLIFPLLILFLFVKLEKNGSGFVLYALTGVAAALGYAVKPQTVIIYIAVIIVTFAGASSHNDKRRMRGILISIISLILMWLLITKVFYPSLNLKLDKNRSFGAAHYLMMGLNDETDGVYSNDDTNFTDSIGDPAERTRTNLTVAKERAMAYGPQGIIKHLIKKQLVNFGDGTFAWGIDGNFFAGTEFEGIPEIHENKLRPYILSVITVGEKYFGKYRIILQTIWITVLFFCFLSGVFALFAGKNSGPVSVMMLSISGLIIFELLFEAKARYLFAYLPIFLILAFSGIIKGSRIK